MNRGRSVLILGIIVVLIAGVALLLSRSGNAGGTRSDPKGDVEISRGPKPPKATNLADLRAGGIGIEGGTATFEATVDAGIPESLKEGAISFRWEITEQGRVTWIVTADVGIERTASVVATQFDYRSSTIDGSLPGSLTVDGKRVGVTLETDDIEGFPTSFEWRLQTELDGDRTRSPSAVATDAIPNDGSVGMGS